MKSSCIYNYLRDAAILNEWVTWSFLYLLQDQMIHASTPLSVFTSSPLTDSIYSFFFFWQRCLFNQMHSTQENIKKKNVFVPPLHFVFLSKCWIGGLVSTSYHRQSSWADGQADALQMVLKTSLNDIPSPNSPHVEPWNLAWYQCSLTGGQLPTFHFHSCLVSEQIKIHNNNCRTSTWCSHAH